MKLLKDTLVKDSSITSYNLVSGSDIGNIKDTRLSRYTLFTYYNGITLNVSFPIDVTIASVGFCGYSFTGETLLSIDGNTPVSLGSGNVGVVDLDTPITGDSFSMKLTNSNVSNGEQIKIGYFILGESYATPGITSNVAFDLITETDVSFSRSHQVYGNPASQYRNVSVVFPVIDQEEKPILDDFLLSVDRHIPFILYFDEDCFNENPLFVVVNNSTLSGYQLNEALFWTSRLSFTEVF